MARRRKWQSRGRWRRREHADPLQQYRDDVKRAEADATDLDSYIAKEPLLSSHIRGLVVSVIFGTLVIGGVGGLLLYGTCLRREHLSFWPFAIMGAVAAVFISVNISAYGDFHADNKKGPLRCRHMVVFGKWGKRCGVCVDEVVSEHAARQVVLARARAALKEAEEAQAIRAAENERKQREKMRSIEGLCSLSPYEFEKVVGQMFSQLGWAVQVTKASGDGGIDVLAQRAGRTLAIQCKRYSPGSRVGKPEIQKLYGAMRQVAAHNAMMVTTSGFTSGAREAAKSLGIEIVDGDELLRLLGEAGML